MSDPFNILGPELDVPPSFDDAVRDAVTRFEMATARFNELNAQIPEEAFTPEEWRAVERAATDVEEAVERAEEGYVAVQYDSHAWYRIMENLDTISARLQSAIGLMERVLERQAGQ
jgi:hypothetical protein